MKQMERCPSCAFTEPSVVCETCPLRPRAAIAESVREHWLDISVIGSSYEEQLEQFSARRRYRPFRAGEWASGSAPVIDANVEVVR